MQPLITKKLDNFFSSSRLHSYGKKEFIIRSQDPIFAIHYIKKGFVRQFIYSENGDDITINIFKPHSFFPIAPFIAQVDNSFNFQAITPVECYRKSPGEVMEFLKSEPDVLMDLARRLSLGLIELATRVSVNPFGSAYKKLCIVLSYFASQFGEKKFGKRSEKAKIKIIIPLTHSEVAGWIGAARETTSRQFGKLSKKGVITYSHTRIVVNDLSALERETK